MNKLHSRPRLNAGRSIFTATSNTYIIITPLGISCENCDLNARSANYDIIRPRWIILFVRRNSPASVSSLAKSRDNARQSPRVCARRKIVMPQISDCHTLNCMINGAALITARGAHSRAPAGLKRLRAVSEAKGRAIFLSIRAWKRLLETPRLRR